MLLIIAHKHTVLTKVIIEAFVEPKHEYPSKKVNFLQLYIESKSE